MTEDLHSETVERSAVVGLFRVLRDMLATLFSRGVSIRYKWDSQSRQHYFEFHVDSDPTRLHEPTHYVPPYQSRHGYAEGDPRGYYAEDPESYYYR